MNQLKKVVLAYSGGLDTSVIIAWLHEQYEGVKVIAVCGDVGQDPAEFEGMAERALSAGADKFEIADLKQTFIEDYIWPTLQADAKYENVYLLGTAFARPILAQRLVEIALVENADAIVHGCTGKGNDQVRFELAIKAFAPEMPVIAPWREWSIKSRDEEIDYAIAHNIELEVSREDSYSKDLNVWHLSHEGLDLEDPANEPKYDEILELGVSPEKAPDEAEYVTISFEQGIPVALDGEKLDSLTLMTKINALGGKHGIGTVDIVENRLVGMKSRGVYETPGGTILYKAHEQLEMVTIDRDTLHLKQKLAGEFADLVYFGKWLTPTRKALSAFVTETQKPVTGEVKVKLYKGNIIIASVTSPYSLYDENIAAFGDDHGVYDQSDAQGFINLYGLPIKVQALKGLNDK